jgi:hypothetical protein
VGEAPRRRHRGDEQARGERAGVLGAWLLSASSERRRAPQAQPF